MALMTNRYAGGETVREMQNISGCKINVQPPYGRDIEREIQLVGSRNAIEQAKIVIMNKITSVVRGDPRPTFPSANRCRNKRTVLLDIAVMKNIVGTHKPNSFIHSMTLVRQLSRAPIALIPMPSMVVTIITLQCGMQPWPSSSMLPRSNSPTSPAHQGFRNMRHKLSPWTNVLTAR